MTKLCRSSMCPGNTYAFFLHVPSIHDYNYPILVSLVLVAFLVDFHRNLSLLLHEQHSLVPSSMLDIHRHETQCQSASDNEKDAPAFTIIFFAHISQLMVESYGPLLVNSQAVLLVSAKATPK